MQSARELTLAVGQECAARQPDEPPGHALAECLVQLLGTLIVEVGRRRTQDVIVLDHSLCGRMKR